jgi:hypothetical protein
MENRVGVNLAQAGKDAVMSALATIKPSYRS